MRRVITVGAGAALLLGLVGPAASAQDDGADLVLHATETASTFITATGVVDPPQDDPSAFAPGARFVSVDTLYSDAARTQQVGRNDISCTVTEIVGTVEAFESSSLLCSGVVTLDGEGQLAWQAAVSFTEEDPEGPFALVAITGGTGAYVDAGGEVALTDESTGPEAVLTRYDVDLSD